MNAQTKAAEIIKGCIVMGDVGAACHPCIAAALTEAVEAERADNLEARKQLAEAAREIPVAGPLPNRIRALKDLHREQLAEAAKPNKEQALLWDAAIEAFGPEPIKRILEVVPEHDGECPDESLINCYFISELQRTIRSRMEKQDAKLP